MKEEPLPCPFCGYDPEIEPWHGGGPRKRLISCQSDSCPVCPRITGSTRARAIRAWNTRRQPSIAELEHKLEEARPVLEAARKLVTATSEYRQAVSDPIWPTRRPGLLLQAEREIMAVVTAAHAAAKGE